MADDYVPPEVWEWERDPNNYFAAINRPMAGPTREAELPVGRHPFQLYSLATPNGQKVTIMFEELLEAGHAQAEYDAWLIQIMEGDQFSSGFVAVNPNSKIPALVDRSGTEPVRVFESGAILIHMAEKFGAFLPASGQARADCLSWLMWQMGSTPFMSAGFGHFYHYAPQKLKYPIDRYALETKRLFDVANRRLAESRYFAGDAPTIADFALFPWLSRLQSGEFYGNANRFLGLDAYENVTRWGAEMAARPAVRRGVLVNSIQGEEHEILRERHDRSDFARFGL
jgi:GSH-dependent disulfide-bond oxidoreductase